MKSYNITGLKYFIYMTSNNNNKFYLPIEIRKIIWEYYNTVLKIKCYVCDTLLINFRILPTLPYSYDNYYITNGIAKCYSCYTD